MLLPEQIARLLARSGTQRQFRLRFRHTHTASKNFQVRADTHNVRKFSIGPGHTASLFFKVTPRLYSLYFQKGGGSHKLGPDPTKGIPWGVRQSTSGLRDSRSQVRTEILLVNRGRGHPPPTTLFRVSRYSTQNIRRKSTPWPEPPTPQAPAHILRDRQRKVLPDFPKATFCLSGRGRFLYFPQARSNHARPSLFFIDRGTSSFYFECKRDQELNKGSHSVRRPFDGLRFGFIQTG